MNVGVGLLLKGSAQVCHLKELLTIRSCVRISSIVDKESLVQNERAMRRAKRVCRRINEHLVRGTIIHDRFLTQLFEYCGTSTIIVGESSVAISIGSLGAEIGLQAYSEWKIIGRF